MVPGRWIPTRKDKQTIHSAQRGVPLAIDRIITNGAYPAGSRQWHVRLDLGSDSAEFRLREVLERNNCLIVLFILFLF